MAYATLSALVARAGGAEVVDLAFPATHYNWVAGGYDAAALDDVRLVAENFEVKIAGDWQSVTSSKLANALADSDAYIDTFLVSRHKLPLTAVPRVLIRVGCDIARFYLYDDSPPNAVATNHAEAKNWLRNIATGTASLGLDADDETVATGPGIRFAANTTVFGGPKPAALDGYRGA